LNSPVRWVDVSGYSAQEGDAVVSKATSSDYEREYLLDYQFNPSLRVISSPDRVPISNGTFVKFQYCIFLICEERTFGRDSIGRGYFVSKGSLGFGLGAETSIGRDKEVTSGTKHAVGIDADAGAVGLATFGVSADVTYNKNEGFAPESSIKAGILGAYVEAPLEADEVEVGIGASVGAYVYKNSETFIFTDEKIFYELWNELGGVVPDSNSL